MALLTVSKQRIGAYGSREFHASVTCISQASREFLLVCLLSPRYSAFFSYTTSADCKRRMVILSAEFVGKQSHEIGPW